MGLKRARLSPTRLLLLSLLTHNLTRQGHRVDVVRDRQSSFPPAPASAPHELTPPTETSIPDGAARRSDAPGYPGCLLKAACPDPVPSALLIKSPSSPAPSQKVSVRADHPGLICSRVRSHEHPPVRGVVLRVSDNHIRQVSGTEKRLNHVCFLPPFPLLLK